MSQVKHRLFVGNVPKGLSEEELGNIFNTNCPGVDNIEFFKVFSFFCLVFSEENFQQVLED